MNGPNIQLFTLLLPIITSFIASHFLLIVYTHYPKRQPESLGQNW